ncbi:c-type cytochrome [Pontibacter arcticus]|uniref:Cytochrome c class I n=1 Tax=Pontibacter arcticus TaxID=2080288 RepID=A0A364RFH8_9BACT|nr:c-type cytochrome [Pontibacter arcticus]RAU83049.1 cytochrome c class I [Pontibacter arcticus]
MKKILSALSICIVLGSCNSNKSEYENVYENKNQAAAEVEAEVEVTDKDNAKVVDEATPVVNAIAKGEKLISLSDCMSCHNIENKIIGPGYKEVAQKYENTPENIDYLAGKIITGGKGVWGEVPMTPHPDLSREDAKQMAQYILSLR